MRPSGVARFLLASLVLLTAACSDRLVGRRTFRGPLDHVETAPPRDTDRAFVSVDTLEGHARTTVARQRCTTRTQVFPVRLEETWVAKEIDWEPAAGLGAVLAGAAALLVANAVIEDDSIRKSVVTGGGFAVGGLLFAVDWELPGTKVKKTVRTSNSGATERESETTCELLVAPHAGAVPFTLATAGRQVTGQTDGRGRVKLAGPAGELVRLVEDDDFLRTAIATRTLALELSLGETPSLRVDLPTYLLKDGDLEPVLGRFEARLSSADRERWNTCGANGRGARQRLECALVE